MPASVERGAGFAGQFLAVRRAVEDREDADQRSGQRAPAGARCVTTSRPSTSSEAAIIGSTAGSCTPARPTSAPTSSIAAKPSGAHSRSGQARRAVSALQRPTRDHRRQVVGAGQRMQEAGAKPARGAGRASTPVWALAAERQAAARQQARTGCGYG